MNPIAPPAAGTLRFVTLNLWGENGPHERRLELVIDDLRRLAPDVIALQEVRAVPGKLANQAETLAAQLGQSHVFASATEWGGGSEGLAIVSRFPFETSTHQRLPHATDTEGRMILSARVATPVGGVWVHTTHLSYRQNEGNLREDQVMAVDAAVATRAPGNDLPQVVLGDFNTGPEADEIRWLGGLCTLGGRRVFYQDAWATVRGGAPGITWARENPFRARMNWLRADRRLDYVFVTAPRRDGRGVVHDARVVCDQPNADGIYPSDHFGVMADVQVAPDAPSATAKG
jgi:endonuclease/exonuclease/phosphatase family metal-dependent hydrolase